MNPQPNLRAVIGGNSPPGPLDFAKEAATALGEWLKPHPVIDDEAASREAKLLIDRAAGSLAAMEAERDGLVRPLNTQVSEINGRYRGVRASLEGVMETIKYRLTAYAKRLETERLRIAEEARLAAQQAADAAREAEKREREAQDDASQGVCDVDVLAASDEADARFAAFEKAQRVAARAEINTKVRITGGFANAISLRNKEILAVSDWKAAIEEMELTEDIAAAILKSARAYRTVWGELPAGITVDHQRKL